MLHHNLIQRYSELKRFVQINPQQISLLSLLPKHSTFISIDNLAHMWLWLFSQDIKCLKEVIFSTTSLTSSWTQLVLPLKHSEHYFLTATESRGPSLVKEYNLYVQIFCKCLYVLLNIVKKKAVLPKMPLCLSSVNFHIMHVRVFFFTFCSRKADNNLLVKLQSKGRERALKNDKNGQSINYLHIES